MVQMHELLTLNCFDETIKIRVPVLQKAQLIFEMPVHSSLDCGGADPDALTTQQGCQAPQYQSAIPPQGHNTAWACTSLRHRAAKLRTMIDLVTESFFQKNDYVWVPAARDPDLRTINADRSILSGMIDL
jgi:hypothetical protein